jgi:hypothetical protein
MKFSSEVHIQSIKNKFNYNDNLIFLGSCFSGNIGNKFSERLFNSQVNPFGVIFNPISIFKLLERSIEKKYFIGSDWIFRNEKWLNLDLHGELSFANLEEALSHSNNLIDEVHNFLKTANYLFLTFGTAWIYSFKENNQLVANCHKIPQKEFEKSMLSISEIIEFGNNIFNKLQTLNKNLKIIFTVSPVRHWADGAHNNNLSKSTLHLAVNEFLKIENTEYFPSYELVIDELRDYRFYDRDLVHPNDLATDFVWEKLSEQWIDANTKKEILEIEKVISSANHRPFNVESEAHQKFVNKTLNKLHLLKKQHTNLNFDNLESLLTKQLM